ncbi:TPA: hypothetical protein ACY2HE_001706 [Yersinia enterocolitica]
MIISNELKWGFLAIPISKNIIDRSAIAHYIAESIYTNEIDINKNLSNIRFIVDSHISDGKSVDNILYIFLSAKDGGAIDEANSTTNKE